MPTSTTTGVGQLSTAGPLTTLIGSPRWKAAMFAAVIAISRRRDSSAAQAMWGVMSKLLAERSGLRCGGGSIDRTSKAAPAIYADSDNTLADVQGTGSHAYNRVEYKYDRQGEVTEKKDQNGTVHDYTRDQLGRETSDAATTLGSGVDGSVRRIDTAYNDAGLVCTVTSYDAVSGGDVVNQVLEQYNAFGQLTADYQEHQGTVNTSVSPVTLYGYAGAAEGLRPTSIAYTNGRMIFFDYGTSRGTDDEINRLETIQDDNGSHDPGPTLDQLSYLGTSTIVTEDYQAAALKLDYTGGDDSYSGLDQFNRVHRQFWAGYGANNTGPLDDFSYLRNPQGDVTRRTNAIDAAFSEMYQNDRLDQLTGLKRGEIVGDDIPSPTFTEGFSPNGNGDLSSVTTNGATQDRQFTAVDQIQNYNDGNGNSTSDWVTPVYDNAGDETTMPEPGSEATGLTCVYDAWNRTVSASAGTTTIIYWYDGMNRMIVRSDGTTATHFYLAGQQVIETREVSASASPLTGGGSAADAAAPVYQWVWSPRYIDAPILRDHYASGEVVSTDRNYFLTDANNNVTSITNSLGAVVERYVYSGFGAATIYAPNYGTVRTISIAGNDLFFGGMRQDAANRLYFDRARAYNSSTGQFDSRDPAESDPNPYRYCGNNPTGKNDPTGLAGPTDGKLWPPEMRRQRSASVQDGTMVPAMSFGEPGQAEPPPAPPGTHWEPLVERPKRYKGEWELTDINTGKHLASWAPASPRPRPILGVASAPAAVPLATEEQKRIRREAQAELDHLYQLAIRWNAEHPAFLHWHSGIQLCPMGPMITYSYPTFFRDEDWTFNDCDSQSFAMQDYLRDQHPKYWSIDVIHGSWGYVGYGMIPHVTGAQENAVQLYPRFPNPLAATVFDVYRFIALESASFPMQTLWEFKTQYPNP